MLLNPVTRRQALNRSLAFTLAVAGTAARSQTPAAWPAGPVRIIVPLPAGGGVDVFVRALAEPLAAALKQTVIVDNKPGAGGLIGAKAAAQAAPDGLTLAYIHSGLVTVQAKNPRLDLLKEFRPVARLSNSPFVVVVSASSRHRTMADLVADVKANPGKLSFGSGGPGSPAHLAVEYLEEKVGNFKALHVPFKGAAEAANALIGGQVDFQIGLLGAVLAPVQGGKLRALAVTGRSRVPQLPAVPTLAEAGVPDFVFEPWGGLAVPAGTPDAVITRLNELLPGVLAHATVKEVMARQGAMPDLASPQSLATQIARELEIDKVVVKRLGMTTQ